jgi:hypothetical protein
MRPLCLVNERLGRLVLYAATHSCSRGTWPRGTRVGERRVRVARRSGSRRCPHSAPDGTTVGRRCGIVRVGSGSVRVDLSRREQCRQRVGSHCGAVDDASALVGSSSRRRPRSPARGRNRVERRVPVRDDSRRATWEHAARDLARSSSSLLHDPRARPISVNFGASAARCVMLCFLTLLRSLHVKRGRSVPYADGDPAPDDDELIKPGALFGFRPRTSARPLRASRLMFWSHPAMRSAMS